MAGQASALNKDDSVLIAFEVANYIRAIWKCSQHCCNEITSVYGYTVRCRYDRNDANIKLTGESKWEGSSNNLLFKARDPLIRHFSMCVHTESYFPMGR